MKTALSMIVVLAIGVFLYGARSGTATPVPVLAAVTVETPAAREQARIVAHLAEVEEELRARDVSHLSPTQRAARAEHIEVLRAYRERGIFPHNHDFPDQRVPYFVDQHGTLCAMAHLISVSGRDDLVARVASGRNNARIAELADEPELLEWLDEAGLSVEEAARIQPMYGCCWVEPVSDRSVDTGYAVASAITGGVAGTSIGMNLMALRSADGRRWPGVFGIAAGAAGMGLGFTRIGDDGTPSSLSTANIAIGALATVAGTWNLVRVPRDRADVPVRAARTATVTAAPVIGVEPETGAGVVVRVRF